MTETYTYRDYDGIPLRITPLSGADRPGARLILREPTVYVDADDAPEVCRAVLAAAGRTDARVVEAPTTPEEVAEEIARILWGYDSGGAPWEAAAEAPNDPGVQDVYLARARAALDPLDRAPATSHVGDTASGSQPDLDAIRARDADAQPLELMETDDDFQIWRRDALTPIVWDGQTVDYETPGVYAVGAMVAEIDREPEQGADVQHAVLVDLLQAREDRRVLLAEVDRLTEAERSRPWMEVYTDPDTGPMIDQVTRELAEAHSERDTARAAWEYARRDLDRYYTAWQSARTRAAAWRQEAEDTRDIHRHSPDYGDWTVCGVSAWTIPATTSPDRVTCPRCRHTEPGWDVTAYRRGAESMRERAFRVADDYTVHRPIRDRIAGRIYALPLAADEIPEASRDDDAESADPGDEEPDLATLDDRVTALIDQVTAAGTAAQLAHTRLDQRTEPGAEVEGMSERVATLESLIRIATTTGDLRNVEDQADDRARRAEERLAAIETRLLAVEQQHTGEAEIVHAVRRRIRAEGATDE